MTVLFSGFLVAFWSSRACARGCHESRQYYPAAHAQPDALFCLLSVPTATGCLLRFLVGVEDVETGEMTLHEAGHAYALRQSVGGRQDNVEEHALENLDWKQRRDALVNQFGSKKKKASIRWGIGRNLQQLSLIHI